MQGLRGARLQRAGDRRVDFCRIEGAPIQPVATGGCEDVVVQFLDNPGFPKPLRVVILRLHLVPWSDAAELYEGSSEARRAAAVHA